MSLNPVQFGKAVIDQFGRYLLTTFPIADADMAAQVKDALRHRTDGLPLLYRGPYVYLNQPFEQGPGIEALIADQALGLHPALKGVFRYDSLHKHQELAMRSIKAGRHTILATGTGSGKTEGFLLPILDHCLHLRDRAPSSATTGEGSGVTAVLVYPMNALVNDQLDRLRRLLAGTRITFARYTGETPDKAGDDLNQLASPRAYTAQELQDDVDGIAPLPIPWEECYDRESILARKPRLLLTNYFQLEYLLLRDRDLGLFRNAPLRFLVFDEVHTYTGELGSEVACLIRRLRDVSGKSPAEVICIGTSATVVDSPQDSSAQNPAPRNDTAINAETATRQFAHRLFGVPADSIEFVTEHYQSVTVPADSYLPPPPPDMPRLLADILRAAERVHLRDEIGELPLELVEATARLCGSSAETVSDLHASTNQRLSDLLRRNRIIYLLGDIFTRPITWDEALPRFRALPDRAAVDDEALIAEMLAYLTLGALAEVDGEPLLRPKLHYFIQGLQGLYLTFEDNGAKRIHFDPDTAQEQSESLVLPLQLCRSCGQHFVRLAASEEFAGQVADRSGGYELTQIPDRFSEPEEGLIYLTDTLHTLDEALSELSGERLHLCRSCGTLHRDNLGQCLNPKCGQHNTLFALIAYRGQLTSCPACGAVSRGKSRTPAIRETVSSEVADIMVLTQSMLSAMEEPPLRKTIIFADNRQDVAFQAGWMEERSKRFRLRHLLYRLLHESSSPVVDGGEGLGSGRIIGFDHLVDDLLAQAQAEQIVPSSEWDDDNERTRVRWFLLEEFASTSQRRNNLEQLGLARVDYHGLDLAADPAFFEQWAARFGIESADVVAIVHLLLDYYRRRGLLSDSLLARYWSYQDIEYRKGLIATADYYRPKALVFEKGENSPFAVSWRAGNGRSGAQTIVEKNIVRGKPDRDRFLEDLWTWLKQRDFLVPIELVQRRYGKIQPIGLGGETLHVNVEKAGFSETTTRFVCDRCQRAQPVMTTIGNCPEYNCKGTLHETGRDEEHYDVVQYTRLSFVPLLAQEHSAQVPKARRQWIEREFKKEGGAVNTIVATPTLELGVDIGRLEMALMRNVPPTPANYAQRAGRAGRRHRIAAVFTYCRGQHHDRYFFNDPPEMIAGAIRVPAFSMQNEPLIRKHVHSTVLTALRELTPSTEKPILEATFPTFIAAYFGQPFVDASGAERVRYLDAPRRFPEFGDLIQRHRSSLVARLNSIFTRNWPTDAAYAVAPEQLGQYLDEMTARLQQHTDRLFRQVQLYNKLLRDLRDREDSGVSLTDEERRRRRQFETARHALEQQSLNNYSLSYLANDGFFPGYALARESVLATSLDPLLEVSRPAATALRELTPANQVYANKNVFAVQTLNFYKLKALDANFAADQLIRRLRFDPDLERVYEPASAGIATVGGADEEILSLQLIDVELSHMQKIDDRQDTRRKVAFDIYGMLLGSHAGGHQGHINELTYRFLQKAAVRLVNIGPTRPGQASPKGRGFPICPQSGEMRSPFASVEEIAKFRQTHLEQFKTEIIWAALHVDIPSDVLIVGPFAELPDAVNVAEALRIGARMVLDMGESEIDAFVMSESTGQYVALYDPLPGGSGFLPQILRYWPTVCQRAVEVLGSCHCKVACYNCLLHFRNQQWHGHLDRFAAIALLEQLTADPVQEHDIPAVLVKDEHAAYHTDSEAEDQFVKILEQRNFPLPPRSQYRVELSGGSFTVADYAYPDETVLIFIDGMSKTLHGDPNQRRKDKLQRAKAKMLGYRVVEITAEALKDDVSLALALDELAVYLGRES